MYVAAFDSYILIHLINNVNKFLIHLVILSNVTINFILIYSHLTKTVTSAQHKHSVLLQSPQPPDPAMQEQSAKKPSALASAGFLSHYGQSTP